jgi:alpha-L-fucosidase
MDVNSEGIYASRPWKIFGEGPVADGRWTPPKGAPKEAPIPYTAEDIRFTTRAGALYAYAMAVPSDGKLLIKSIPKSAGRVTGVSLLGKRGRVKWSQTPNGLAVTVPALGADAHTVGLRIRGLTI